ncbi:PucR family transcriptional regulator [Oceanobacillus profundus]|uniref:PucR C-terminal helix-turn-helix domain-containing protein n=1 Tax=Oceanobacillus profundus TaxID=372463 RepID=A0A417YLJ1_9BACI|nr:helix-turn-helix domain-containing protein [Oceanobacillus profundus]RHW34359.1 hypothetical protein D1B32_04115 [Oceanobacillus profundus]
MYKMLKNFFPTFLIYDENISEIPDDYQWFVTDTNAIIGIAKSDLSAKDAAMLSTFLTPYQLTIPKPTDLEKLWKNRIHHSSSMPETSHEKFRFVYFSFPKNQIEPNIFRTAMYEFFSNPIPILWENEQEGILIEQQGVQLEDSLTYDQIVDTLMSDLYVKTKFFIGPYLEAFKDLSNQYLSFIQLAKISASYSDNPVITYVDAIPFRLVNQIPFEQRNQISNLVLKEFKNDEEMLQTIWTFIQCNLNISLTAKKLYMHRNSLQYRIDKFFEKTGIDVRQFNQALTVYIALLATMHKEPV